MRLFYVSRGLCQFRHSRHCLLSAGLRSPVVFEGLVEVVVEASTVVQCVGRLGRAPPPCNATRRAHPPQHPPLQSVIARGNVRFVPLSTSILDTSHHFFIYGKIIFSHTLPAFIYIYVVMSSQKQSGNNKNKLYYYFRQIKYYISMIIKIYILFSIPIKIKNISLILFM